MEQRRKRPLWIRLWLGGLAVILLGPVIPVPASAVAEGIRKVGEIPVVQPEGAEGLSGNGSMILNPESRRGYQIFRLSGSETFIQAIDLDTLKKAGSATIPGHPSPGSRGAQFGEFVHAVDIEGDRIYLPYTSGGAFSGISEIDGSTLEVHRFMSRVEAFQPEVDPTSPCTAVSCVPTPVGANPEIRGLSFVPAIDSPASRDKLLMILQDSTSAASNFQSLVWVAQWDVETAKQDWIYRVNSCGSRRLPDDPLSRYQTAVFQSPGLPYIYLGCFGSGSTGQVVRLDQDGTSRPTAETAFPGPLGLVDVLADPSANRMHLKIVNDEGESYWVFDGQSTSYVGVIGTTLGPVSASAGLDPDTGRLYVLAPSSVSGNRKDPGGLFVADARRSPAPQAIVFPSFATPSTQRVLVDPATEDRARRIFVLPQDDQARGNKFIVYEDTVQVTVDPPVADQDRFTSNVDEVPGVTQVNFTGTAHAYGLRSVLVGGLEGTTPTRGTPAGSPLSFVGSPCMKPDREVVVGRVKRAALSNNLASATTIAGDAEAVTRADVQQPSTRCYPRGAPVISGLDALGQENLGPVLGETDAVAGREWPFEEAECAGDGEVTEMSDQAVGFTASSLCRQSKEEVIASGAGEAFSAAGLTVGQTSTSVRLARRPGEGLFVRSEAWVRGIEVPGAFTIEAARTVGEAFAGGRPGTAGTTFTREICGVRVFGAALGQEEDVVFEGCYDPFAQVDEVGEQVILNNQVTDRPLFFLLNRAMGSRGRIRVPDPDEELKKGTPGGYLASVQKNRGEEIQARVISNDASTEVPAFELIMFNDDQSFGRGRQLYQFAGVDASSTYGLFLPPTFDFGDGGGTEVEPFSLPNLLTEMTGGMPDFVAPEAAPAADVLATPRNVVAQAVNAVGRGLAFLARSPREAVLAASVWFLLGLPVYFASRRRLLMAKRGI